LILSAVVGSEVAHAAGTPVGQEPAFARAVDAFNARDFAVALQLLHKLADDGYAPAQNNLGMMYATGQGAPQDYAAAAVLLRKAADQGYGLGEYDLGAMYGNGLGMPQNYVQAYKWFDLAADSAAEASVKANATRDRDGVATAMTAAQIAEARRLAEACRQTHFLACD
jgi:TPR repeat protein